MRPVGAVVFSSGVHAMKYHTLAGSITDPTGRVIDPADAEAYVREWAADVARWEADGQHTLARAMGATAVSLGEAWIKRRDWGRCSSPVDFRRAAT